MCEFKWNVCSDYLFLFIKQNMTFHEIVSLILIVLVQNSHFRLLRIEHINRKKTYFVVLNYSENFSFNNLSLL